MSLRGRYIIDRIKRVVSKRLKMPVPPYGDPAFWDNVYQKMDDSWGPNHQHTAQDAFEWGNILLEDLLEYDYRKVTIGNSDTNQMEYASSSDVGEELFATTFAETIGVPRDNHPIFDNTNDENDGDQNSASTDTENTTLPKQPILMLGCGNSQMGEHLIEQGWKGPVIQVDIAAQALEMIKKRTSLPSTQLQFVQEDATHLGSFKDNSIAATIDKGTLDAMFCADAYDQMRDILKTQLRVLKPGGVLSVFSFSRPEFLLPQLMPLRDQITQRQVSQREGGPYWQSLQMQELDRFLLYRFQKSRQQQSTNNRIQEPSKWPSKKRKQ